MPQKFEQFSLLILGKHWAVFHSNLGLLIGKARLYRWSTKEKKKSVKGPNSGLSRDFTTCSMQGQVLIIIRFNYGLKRLLCPVNGTVRLRFAFSDRKLLDFSGIQNLVANLKKIIRKFISDCPCCQSFKHFAQQENFLHFPSESIRLSPNESFFRKF